MINDELMTILLKSYAYLFNECLEIWLVMFTLFAYPFYLFLEYNGLIFSKELFICDGVIYGGYIKKIGRDQVTKTNTISFNQFTR